MLTPRTHAVVAFFAMCAITSPALADKTYDVTWTIEVRDIEAGTKQAEVWISVPQERPEQSVSNLAVHTPYPWKFVEDPDFHNKIVQVTVPTPPAAFAIDLAATVTRAEVTGPVAAKLGEAERALCLREEALVSLSPRIRSLADSLGGDHRTRYEYVLDLMKYDKTAPGWGLGDSERACDVRLGNCTDFHSLFMSLSRAKQVPVIFEMGYTTLPAGESAKVGGYHCWAWYYDDTAAAWSPVDISEADKFPEKAEYFFGHLDADRIVFSRGRAIRLPGMQGEPLNYLPSGAYAEIDGKPHASVTRAISYTVDAGEPGAPGEGSKGHGE